jgi:DNA adenine methylase
MVQETLFGIIQPKVVNVSQVPHRSPFRYPGGKTWLVPRIRQWLKTLPFQPNNFIEPFAGGAIVGLTVAFENLSDKVVLVELDEDISAVWKTIFSLNGPLLAQKILTFEPTEKNLTASLSAQARSPLEQAFQTILKNRVSHGGIIANGSGIMKSGENGKGIFSRWYPETLSKRIINLHEIRKKIKFIQGDGLEAIIKYGKNRQNVFFIDPPYTAGGKKAGQRLYKYNQINHEKLFKLSKHVKGDCLLTYDDAIEVQELAVRNGFDYKEIAMQNRHNSIMNELLVGKNLRWLDK